MTDAPPNEVDWAIVVTTGELNMVQQSHGMRKRKRNLGRKAKWLLIFGIKDSIVRRKGKVLFDRNKLLQDGWRLCKKKRKSGKSAGRVDQYYLNPDGLLFRSTTEVYNFLQKALAPAAAPPAPAPPALAPAAPESGIYLNKDHKPQLFLLGDATETVACRWDFDLNVALEPDFGGWDCMSQDQGDRMP